ncbi:MAG: GNAT family N-acetyltransferase [Clostridiales bacterium]|nr:GNAT family N-acetyltransferase [Clostridiales bacterium]
MMNTLEAARPNELDACWAIIREGRAFQNEQGFVQWTEDYPNRETLRQDIEEGKGFVLKVDGTIAAYMCVDFDGEPAYADIEGRWETKEPYAVVHRMAFASEFRGRGLTADIFALIERLCLSRGIRSLRADTDFPNLRMQHVLEKCGFVRRGVVIFQGSGKLAYDKTLV